jgi:hypothetical protein
LAGIERVNVPKGANSIAPTIIEKQKKDDYWRQLTKARN